MRKLHYILQLIGFDFKKMFLFFKNLNWFISDLRRFKKLNQDENFKELDYKFCLFDKGDNSGNIADQYLYQDVYMGNLIFINNPIKHVDVGSRIDGFISAVASFRYVEVFDIRPLNTFIHKNIKFTELDFTSVPSKYHEYTDSLSCLHTLEHVGLGRYGDKVDPNGYIDFFNNLAKILKPGGKLYISTPIGMQRIVFNAHRVFGLDTLIKLFGNKFYIVQFSYIDDSLNFHDNLKISSQTILECNSLKYGLSLFVLEKKD